MTRLEQHQRRFTLDERRGELLRHDELDADELTFLNRIFFERVRENPPEDVHGLYQIYVGVLHEWGVMCPHPIDRRRYPDDPRWYDCTLCGSAVINR